MSRTVKAIRLCLICSIRIARISSPSCRIFVQGRQCGLAAAFRANSNFPLETTAMFPFVPGFSWSDHRSFWRQGYRAVMITDTA